MKNRLIFGCVYILLIIITFFEYDWYKLWSKVPIKKFEIFFNSMISLLPN